jgi:hypothetical protein
MIYLLLEFTGQNLIFSREAIRLERVFYPVTLDANNQSWVLLQLSSKHMPVIQPSKFFFSAQY